MKMCSIYSDDTLHKRGRGREVTKMRCNWAGERISCADINRLDQEYILLIRSVFLLYFCKRDKEASLMSLLQSERPFCFRAAQQLQRSRQKLIKNCAPQPVGCAEDATRTSREAEIIRNRSQRTASVLQPKNKKQEK